MAREVMHRSRTKMEPQVPAVPDWFQVPELTTRPEWTMARPPYREDSGMERVWSVVLTPVRAIALMFLWMTYQWWRTALVLGTIVGVILVWYVR
jgi:hypothetical protein